MIIKTFKAFSSFLILTSFSIANSFVIASCSYVKPSITVSGNSGAITTDTIYNFNIERFGIYDKNFSLNNFLIRTFDVDEQGHSTGVENDALNEFFLNYDYTNDDDDLRKTNILKLQTVSSFEDFSKTSFSLNIILGINSSLYSDTYYTYYSTIDMHAIPIDCTITDSTIEDNLYKDPTNPANDDKILIPPNENYNSYTILHNGTLGYIISPEDFTELYLKWLIGRLYSDMISEIHDFISRLKATFSIKGFDIDIPKYCIRINFIYDAENGIIDEFTMKSKNYSNHDIDGSIAISIPFVGTSNYWLNIFTIEKYSINGAFRSMPTLNYLSCVPQSLESRFIYHIYPENNLFGILPSWNSEKFYSKNGYFGDDLSLIDPGLYFKSYYIKQIWALDPIIIKEFRTKEDEVNPSEMPTVIQPGNIIDGLDYSNLEIFNNYFCNLYEYNSETDNTHIGMVNPNEAQTDYNIIIQNSTKTGPYLVTIIDKDNNIINSNVPFYQVIRFHRWQYIQDELNPYYQLEFATNYCYLNNGSYSNNYPIPAAICKSDNFWFPYNG